MRFNGVDIRDVHRAVSVEKEIPPGMPEMTIETAQGWDGETFVGRAVRRVLHGEKGGLPVEDCKAVLWERKQVGNDLQCQ